MLLLKYIYRSCGSCRYCYYYSSLSLYLCVVMHRVLIIFECQ